MSIGNALRKFRENKGLSLRQLEDKAGLKAQYIFRIENGDTTNPSLKNLITLCESLNITIIDLFDAAGFSSSIPDLELAIQNTLNLSPSQKKILMDLYREFSS